MIVTHKLVNSLLKGFMRLRIEKITGNSKLPSEGIKAGCVWYFLSLYHGSVVLSCSAGFYSGGANVIMGEGFASRSLRICLNG